MELYKLLYFEWDGLTAGPNKVVWINPMHITAIEYSNGVTTVKTINGIYNSTQARDSIISGLKTISNKNILSLSFN